MPVVVVATIAPKPEHVDAVRAILRRTVEDVHGEPGCQLYALHEAEGTFIIVEQWVDSDARQVHTAAPAVTSLVSAIADSLATPPVVVVAEPISAGVAAKGQLVN